MWLETASASCVLSRGLRSVREEEALSSGLYEEDLIASEKLHGGVDGAILT